MRRYLLCSLYVMLVLFSMETAFAAVVNYNFDELENDSYPLDEFNAMFPEFTLSMTQGGGIRVLDGMLQLNYEGYAELENTVRIDFTVPVQSVQLTIKHFREEESFFLRGYDEEGQELELCWEEDDRDLVLRVESSSDMSAVTLTQYSSVAYDLYWDDLVIHRGEQREK